MLCTNELRTVIACYSVNCPTLYVPEKGWRFWRTMLRSEQPQVLLPSLKPACHRTHRQGDPGQLGPWCTCVIRIAAAVKHDMPMACLRSLVRGDAFHVRGVGVLLLASSRLHLRAIIAPPRADAHSFWPHFDCIKIQITRSSVMKEVYKQLIIASVRGCMV